MDVFVHIPKTAGSSLRQIIDQNYGPNNQFMFLGNYKEYKEVLETPNDFIPKDVNIIHGHHPFGLGDKLADLEISNYFSFLRAPIDRVISEYFFAFQQDSGFHPFIKNRKLSFCEFFNGDIKVLKNPMTRWIAGIHPREQTNLSDEQILEQAKRNVEGRIKFIGFTEFFDESILILSKELGLTNPFYIRQNVSDKPANIKKIILKDDVCEGLLGHINLDDELYGFALKLFRKKLLEQPPIFWEALSEYKKINKKLNEDNHKLAGQIYTAGRKTSVDTRKYLNQAQIVKNYLDKV